MNTLCHLPPKGSRSWGATPPPDVQVSTALALPTFPCPAGFRSCWLRLCRNGAPSARELAVTVGSALKPVLTLAAQRTVSPVSLHTPEVGSCFLKVVLRSLIKILKSLGFSPRRIRKSYYIMKLIISPFGPAHCFSWTQHLHSQALKICC